MMQVFEDSQFSALIQASYPKTINGLKFFHSNYYQQFYKQHSNIKMLPLIEIQIEMNLKINNSKKKITNKMRKDQKKS